MEENIEVLFQKGIDEQKAKIRVKESQVKAVKRELQEMRKELKKKEIGFAMWQGKTTSKKKPVKKDVPKQS